MRGRRDDAGPRLTVRATVAPDLVADLTDLLQRVTGRAAADESGAITVTVAPGVSSADLERELQTVVHRWSEMHPDIRVELSARPDASRGLHHGRRAQEPVPAVTQSSS